MKTFKDNAGRTWSLCIHVTAVKRCRALLNLDLYALVDDGFQGLGKLLGDPVSLVDMIYVLCKDDADRLYISDEDFGRSMAGDVIEAASNAFIEEFTDFFPDPRVRAGLKTVMEKSRKMADRLMKTLELQLNAIDVDLEAAKLIASSGTSRGSSASTPDPSPSAS